MANDTTVIIPNARLAHELKVSTSKRGTQYLQMRFATTPRYRDKNTNQWVDGETEWWNVTEFDTARMETYMRELHKGTPVRIEGVLELSTYQDRNGQIQIDRTVRFARISKNLPKAKRDPNNPNQGFAGNNQPPAPSQSAITGDAWATTPGVSDFGGYDDTEF